MFARGVVLFTCPPGSAPPIQHAIQIGDNYKADTGVATTITQAGIKVSYSDYVAVH